MRSHLRRRRLHMKQRHMRLRPVKEPEQSTGRDEGRVLGERSINLPDRSLKALCYGGSHHRDLGLSRYSTARAGGQEGCRRIRPRRCVRS
jgi:hypothetical protein